MMHRICFSIMAGAWTGIAGYWVSVLLFWKLRRDGTFNRRGWESQASIIRGGRLVLAVLSLLYSIVAAIVHFLFF